MRAAVPLAVVLASLAGCASPAEDVLDVAGRVLPHAAGLPVFAPPKLLDEVRAGGEPVIAFTPKGTILVSAHPGFTHYHPSDPTHPGVELLAPANAQSYMWRSTDGGETWAHVGIAGTETGPRSTGFGVSDPEFTVMADGTVCYTDLESLAMSSVSCSTDDGVTWIGNPVASQRPNDRQWLASHGNELYFTANFFTDHRLLASTDRGVTWEMRGDTICSGDIVANPSTGAIYAGCGNGLSVSTDGGRTFERREANDDETSRAMTEPAVDAAGNVWIAYASRDEASLTLVGTPDDGATWPWTLEITPRVHDVAEIESGVREHRFVWPWISAGSAGRVAVSWIGAHVAERSGDAPPQTEWRVYTAFVLGASTPDPAATILAATPDPMHRGAICQRGTACQISSVQGDPKSDRRLGDFFETAIDLDGYLHLAFSNTAAKPGDVISHPMHVKQTDGPRLLLPGDRPATQG